jgi:hypothetical protein
MPIVRNSVRVRFRVRVSFLSSLVACTFVCVCAPLSFPKPISFVVNGWLVG